MKKMTRLHRSVLVNEVFEFINISSKTTVLDLTFGEGGHSEVFLKKGVNQVVGVDRDISTIERYIQQGAEKNNPKLKLIYGAFSEVLANLEERFDYILMDLGVSTQQILSQERGFSFEGTGPLDMRMDLQSLRTLESILKTISEEELALALEKNADLKGPRRIARILLQKFHQGDLKNTQDLAHMMGKRIPGKPHPATVLFMALRMLVNDELSEIEQAIPLAIQKLNKNGRLLVITFHSNEDRLVKKLLQKFSGKCICDEKVCLCSREAVVKILTPKPIIAEQQELLENPRARSAKLRVIEKIL